MQVNDIVKWVNALNYAETSDIMIVEKITDGRAMVIHINEPHPSRSIEWIDKIRVVGHMNPSDSYQDIINKFKNK